MQPSMTSSPSDRARFGPYEVDLHTHELWKFGTRLKLIGQPFEILAVLLSRPGELVTRDELRQRLWPSDTFVDFNHGLNAAVNKLRDTLSDSAENPRYVETLPRRGYRFIAEIEWLTDEPGSAQPAPKPVQVVPAIPPTPVAAPPEVVPLEVATENVVVPAQRRGLQRFFVGAGALFVFLVAAVFVVRTVASYGSRNSQLSMVERTRPLVSIADTSSPAFSPDGTSVAFSRNSSDPGIYVTQVGSDRPLRLTTSKNDCCPVWSPDGRWIGFTRYENHQAAIYIVPSDGGGEHRESLEKAVAAQTAAFKLSGAGSAENQFEPVSPENAENKLKAEKNLVTQATLLGLAALGYAERKIETGAVIPQHGEIDWSPDGKSIAFSGPSGLYAVTIDNSTVRRITTAPPQSEDWGPQFSPDGRDLLFVRNHQVGQPNELWITPATGGEGARLLTERGTIDSPAQWSYDGRSVIFSSNRTGHPALYRAPLDAPDSSVEISQAGSPAWDPTVSRRGYRLAYERLLRSLSIWQLDLSDSAKTEPYLVVSSTSDTDQGPAPQFSPDGKRLAFMSDRGGTMEIWIANRDGSNPFQLTAVGGAGTPRWSPDSQAVVFDVRTPNGEKIVSMNLHGGAPQVLTDGVCPSWSRDGNWIYFASANDNGWQVWKIRAEGGQRVQVTERGGHAALESLDGKYIYYAKTAYTEPEVWRKPVGGGEEVPMPLIRPGTWASFQVVEGGVLFVGPALGHQAVLNFYDSVKDRTSTVTVLNRVPFWLGATPDGHTVAFDQPGQEEAQAMLVENFR